MAVHWNQTPSTTPGRVSESRLRAANMLDRSNSLRRVTLALAAIITTALVTFAAS